MVVTFIDITERKEAEEVRLWLSAVVASSIVLKARLEGPDAVIGVSDTGIGMPDLSGHEVARQIRQTEWGKHMVLIAATGWGQDSDEREAMEAGFDAHMTKPVDLRELSAVVDELLLRKRG